MKGIYKKLLATFAILVMATELSSAQNRPVPPGTPPPFVPNTQQGPGPGAGFGPNVPMWGTSNSMMNGGQWGPGAWSGPMYNVNYSNPNIGTSNIIAVGYDAQGVWETIPMQVKWVWNGVTYSVTVINAWNPWTQSWGVNLGVPAFSTMYELRGTTYSYYTNLSTGTYYFNL